MLPVHGGMVMVSALHTMSSVTYSIFLLRKSFTWPAQCQVVWRKTNCPANKGRFSNGCKDTTAGLVSAGLPVTWPQPAFPHQDRDRYAIQPQQFPHPGQQDFPSLPMRQEASGHSSSSHVSRLSRLWDSSPTKPWTQSVFWKQDPSCH